MVLLVLALAWGTVLFFWLRSRSQDTFGDSVGLFHRHLHVLERAAPVSLIAANRLRVPDHQRPFTAPRLRAAGSALPRAGAQGQVRGGAPLVAVKGSGAQLLAQSRRRQTMRRRRDVLFVLVVLVVATLVVAAVTGARLAIFAQVATDLAFVGYVAVLIRLRNLAAEREMKVRVISRPDRRVRSAAGRRAGPRSVGYAPEAYQGYDDGGYEPAYAYADGTRYEPDDYGYESAPRYAVASGYEPTRGYAPAPGYAVARGYAMAGAPDLRRVAVNY